MVLNTGGQSFGLKGKVDVSPEKRSLSRLEKDVERTLGKAEQSFGRGFEARTMGGVGGGRRGPGIGGATAAGAGGVGLLSRLGGGGALKMLGTVAIGGTVAVGMLKAMQRSSGYLKASTGLLGTAVSLFFKPFGDYLGRTLLPLSKSLLEMAVGLNKNIGENGLIIGGMQSLLDFVNNLPGELGKVLVRTWGQALEGLFGENRFFTAMQNFQWSDWIPIVKWDDLLGGALDFVSNAWPGWPDVLGLWDSMGGWPDLGGLWPGWDDFVPRIDWSDFIPNVNWQIPDILLGPGGDGGGTPTTTTTTTPTETRDLTPEERRIIRGTEPPRDTRFGPIFHPGDPAIEDPDRNPLRVEVNPTIEMDGRRVSEEALSETNTFLRSL